MPYEHKDTEEMTRLFEIVNKKTGTSKTRHSKRDNNTVIQDGVYLQNDGNIYHNDLNSENVRYILGNKGDLKIVIIDFGEAEYHSLSKVMTYRNKLNEKGKGIRNLRRKKKATHTNTKKTRGSADQILHNQRGTRRSIYNLNKHSI